jgi:hypothetical protein
MHGACPRTGADDHLDTHLLWSFFSRAMKRCALHLIEKGHSCPEEVFLLWAIGKGL